MTSEESIEEKLKNLARLISPEDKIVENVMSRIDAMTVGESGRIEKVGARVIARRLIMNRFTKFAFAAVLIAVVVLSIIILDKSATPAYGITDMPELFSKARFIHVQGRMYFPGHTMPDGQQITPVEMEQWIDLENGRVQFTSCGLTSNQDGIRITVGETISDGQFKLILLHTDKSAIFFKMSEYQQMLEKHLALEQMFGQMFGDIDRLDSFVKTGERKLTASNTTFGKVR